MSEFTSIFSSHWQWVLLSLWLLLFILSGIISPLFSSSILGTYRPGDFIFQCHIFCLFMLFMGFSRQEYRNGLPFPSSVDHDLSEFSNMTLPWGLILAPQPLYPGKCLYNRTTDTSQEDVWLLNENMALSIRPAHLAGAVNQLLDCMTSVSTGFPFCFDGFMLIAPKELCHVPSNWLPQFFWGNSVFSSDSFLAIARLLKNNK